MNSSKKPSTKQKILKNVQENQNNQLKSPLKNNQFYKYMKYNSNNNLESKQSSNQNIENKQPYNLQAKTEREDFTPKQQYNIQKQQLEKVLQLQNQQKNKLKLNENKNIEGTSKMEDFEIMKKLGQGAFGKIYKVKRKKDNKLYVCKIINLTLMNQQQRKKTMNEAILLNQLDHQYIVKYYDSFLENDKLHIVMEYCDYGDLQTFIKGQMGRPLEEFKIWQIFIQVCSGLQKIHSMNILHRDIKPQNIFLNQDKSVRIGDLGVAKTLNADEQFAHNQAGTPYYMSPEVCQEQPYNEKSDIWSLGVVLYELTTFKKPFDSGNQQNLAYKILQGTYLPISKMYSSDLQQMIDKCLTKNHKKRISLKEILENPFIITKAKIFNIKYHLDNDNNKKQFTQDFKQRRFFKNQTSELENKSIQFEKESPTKKLQNSVFQPRTSQRITTNNNDKQESSFGKFIKNSETEGTPHNNNSNNNQLPILQLQQESKYKQQLNILNNKNRRDSSNKILQQNKQKEFYEESPHYQNGYGVYKNSQITQNNFSKNMQQEYQLKSQAETTASFNLQRKKNSLHSKDITKLEEKVNLQKYFLVSPNQNNSKNGTIILPKSDSLIENIVESQMYQDDSPLKNQNRGFQNKISPEKNKPINYSKQVEQILQDQKLRDKLKTISEKQSAQNSMYSTNAKQGQFSSVINTPKRKNEQTGIPFSKSVNPFKSRRIKQQNQAKLMANTISTSQNSTNNNLGSLNNNMRQSDSRYQQQSVMNSYEQNNNNNLKKIQFKKNFKDIQEAPSPLPFNLEQNNNIQNGQKLILQPINDVQAQALQAKYIEKQQQLQQIVKITRNEMGRLDYLELYNIFQDKFKNGNKDMDDVQISIILEQKATKCPTNPQIVNNLFKIMNLENDLQQLNTRIQRRQSSLNM